jgi:hypothetical protein
MTKNFTLLFLFTWALMILGYLLGVFEGPPKMLFINSTIG